ISARLVIVDFEEATYIDSTVLECLVALELATRKRNARLVLVGVGHLLQRIFLISGLDRYFNIRRSLSDVREARRSEASQITLVAQAHAV
ncbi:MAG TPA: STAS domain-containing protein, partial [Candidatus Tumulicola sp.]|nr:STAS domain-containing protein [Candidatus Tumulicola sp.]